MLFFIIIILTCQKQRAFRDELIRRKYDRQLSIFIFVLLLPFTDVSTVQKCSICFESSDHWKTRFNRTSYSITFEWSLPTHNKHNLVLSCVFVCLCVSAGVLCVRPFYVPASMCVCVCVWASFAEKSGSTVTEVGCRASSADHCCSGVCLVESASYDLACLRPSPVSCGCERALG